MQTTDTSTIRVVPATQKPSLLFVDDEPSIVTALRVVFRSGYQVTVTTDPQEAIEFLKTRHFDVVVSDQRMPQMTGVELLRHAFELSPTTVRILLTGYSDTDAVVGAINDVEVHRFLQKPWDNVKLKHVVDEAVVLAKTLAGTLPLPPVEGADDQDGDGGAASGSPDGVPAASASAAGVSALAAALQHAQEKEAVLIVDAKATLYAQAESELGGKVRLLHATDLNQVFAQLEREPVGVLVCVFDVQSETDRTFLQMLKQAHPYVLVIAVCDSLDSTRLIELINRARIYRFMRKPVSWTLLTRYIQSAVNHVHEIKRNPVLVHTQAAEGPPEGAVERRLMETLNGHFARINQSFLARFGRVAGLFRRA
jgi:DNA-binding NtrC family response regulator